MQPILSGIALSMVLLGSAALCQTPLVESRGPGCGGVGGAATLGVVPNMVIGGLSQVQLRNLPPNSNGLIIMSWNGSSWNTAPLPTSMAGIGMPGCTLYTRPEQHYPFLTGPGSYDWNLATPGLPAFLGAELYAQGFFTQAGLNPLGIGTTNGLHVRIGSGAGMASSVSQWGITWTFDRPYPVGQFCNGDWWVLGPVTIVQITPGCQNSGGRIINGSMINPTVTGRQGYDSALYGPYAGGNAVYDANLNVGLNLSPTHPLTLPVSTSLISCISQIGPASNNSESQLRTAAVLTVLDNQPPSDAFRPPYTGSDKTIRHHESELNYGALARLTPASVPPDLRGAADGFARVWLDHCVSFVGRYLHPVENMPDYYRDFTALTGSSALLLNCDYSNAQKRDLLVGFVQRGLDDYGNILNGARWYVSGHCNGRKFPIIFAGRVLGDTAMTAVGTTYATVFYGPNDPRNVAGAFSEDGQTFFVQETSPGVYNWGYGNYSASQVGMPEWGNYHTADTSSDSSSWTASAYRTCCSANAWAGVVLTMRIMGLRWAWNQPAFFDYMDRYMQTESPGNWTYSWDPWTGRMWQQFRPQF